MNITLLHQIIIDSVSSQWKIIDAPIMAIKEDSVFECLEYTKFAIYKPDVNISMAWGGIFLDSCNYGWTNNFPKKSSQVALDLFYSKKIVDRIKFFFVNEMEACLPSPDSKKIEGQLLVDNNEFKIIKIIHDLNGVVNNGLCNSYEEYFRRAGFEIDPR
jgi:hypothetical protein